MIHFIQQVKSRRWLKESSRHERHLRSESPPDFFIPKIITPHTGYRATQKEEWVGLAPNLTFCFSLGCYG